MEYVFDLQLTERELYCIGAIVALWASIEHEIFYQTLISFGDPPQGPLPKELNNIQFSKVLELWESRVVSQLVGDRKTILEKQLKKINLNYNFRNALVHGMWNWSKDSPDKITAIRVRKNEVISIDFTTDDLASFASELEKINFQVRFPGGFEELADAMTEQGSHISRRAFHLRMTTKTRNNL